MTLQFQPPTDLINAYFQSKQANGQAIQNALPQALSAYAEIKKQNDQKAYQQKVLDSQDAERKAKEFAAIAPYIPEDQIPFYARSMGLNIPGATAPTIQNQSPQQQPIDAQGNVIGGPMEGPALPGASMAPNGIKPASGMGAPSPIIDHWNSTMGQSPIPTGPGAGVLGGLPPMGPRPTSKYGLEKYQKNLAMTKTEGEMAPKTPITKEDLLASGKPFDPMSQMLVEPPDKSGNDQKYENEQNRLEQQAIDRVSKLRGDASLARTEVQRDAAIQAYNTIERVKQEGRVPSQLEYYDLLGQMWKARTGASPTDQSLKDLDAKTFKGDLGKAYQYFSGKPAGVTTGAVLQNIQDFASDSGMQADKFHDSYMTSHKLKPQALEDSRWQPIAKSAHGISFAEATGYQPKNGANMPTISDDASFAALPSGAKFKDPSGQVHRKK